MRRSTPGGAARRRTTITACSTIGTRRICARWCAAIAITLGYSLEHRQRNRRAGQVRRVTQLAAQLTTIVHEEDLTRPVTAGANNLQAGYNGFQKTVDVFGYNYKPTEYGKFRQSNPTIPMLCAAKLHQPSVRVVSISFPWSKTNSGPRRFSDEFLRSVRAALGLAARR